MNSSNDTRTLWISLGAGLVAAFLLYSYSQEKKSEYDNANGAPQTVVIAATDIQEMATIDDTMLEVTQKPAKFIEPGAVKQPDWVVGQVAAAPIKKGEQILVNKVLQPGIDTGIALQVSPSKRALALPISEDRAVAKLIRPGDRVDIYAAIDTGKGLNTKREVSLLMEDVVVLATGISIVNNLPRNFELTDGGKNISVSSLVGNTTYNTLTVEASPKEAQDLIYIMSSSAQNLFFTLRNPNDRKVQQMRLPASSSDSLASRLGLEGGSTAGLTPLPNINTRPGTPPDRR